MYKAIFFDIGGVCVHSPLEGIRAYERSRGFPENYLNVAIQSRTPHGAFHRLERNELTLEEFYPLFGREMSDPGNREVYREWMKKRAPNQQQQSGLEWDETMDWTVDGKSFFFQMMKEASKVDEVVVGCVRKLKEIGKWKVVALTNNFIIPRTTPTTNTTNNNAGSPTKHEEEDDLSFLLPPPHLTSLFDHYLESSILHLRKPDPAIFLRACDMVGVHPKHVIMIDDIGENLKSARGVGMTTVRVYPGKAREAMVQLEGLLGVEILERKKVPEVTGSTIIHILPYDDAAFGAFAATAPSSVSDVEMDKEVSYNTNDTTHNDGSLSSTTNNSTTTNTNTKAKTNTDTNMDMDTDRAIPSFQLLTPDQELNKIYELFPVLEIPQPLPLPPASSSSAVASSSLRRKSTARSTSLKPSSPTEMSIGVRRTRASTRKLTQNRVAEVTGEIEEMVGGKGGVDPFEFPPATTSTSFHSASPSSSAGVSSSSSSSAPSSVVLAVDGQRRKRRRTSPGRDDITRIPATNTNTITTSSLSNTPSISNTQPTFSPSEITYLTSLLSPQTYLSRHRRHQYTEIRTRNIERETVRHYLHSVGSDAKAVLAQWDVGRERRELVDKIKREGGLKSVWWNNDDNKQSDDNDDERDDVRISQEKIKTPAFHKNKPRTTLHPTIPHPHHTDTNTTTTTHRRSARLTRTRTPFPFGVPFPPVLLSDPSAPQDFDDCVVRFL